MKLIQMKKNQMTCPDCNNDLFEGLFDLNGIATVGYACARCNTIQKFCLRFIELHNMGEIMDEEIENKINVILEQETLSTNPKLHERAADVVSSFGGSWSFIFLFLLFFGGWIIFNLYIYSFDNYPFILLNLVLSCLAVFQAPFILMSQNRLSSIDRKRAENDYKIDLTNQFEIANINKKLDLILQEIDRKSNDAAEAVPETSS